MVAAHLVACALGASGVPLVLNQSVTGTVLANAQVVYNLTSPACAGQCVFREHAKLRGRAEAGFATRHCAFSPWEPRARSSALVSPLVLL